jgi:hypothetical protein
LGFPWDHKNDSKEERLNFGLIAASLVLPLTSCVQTPIIIDDNLTNRQHEQMEMVLAPSAQSLNESLVMDIKG